MSDIEDEPDADLNLNSLQGGGMGPFGGMLPPGMASMDPAKFAKMNENQETKSQLKLSEHINKMDDEFRDRFKALKVIQDLMHDADEDEQKQIRKLEIEFEN